MQGGEIDFEMGSQPSATYGTGSGNEPVSGIYDHLIVPVPAITDATKVFTDKKEVTITSVPEAEIYYTLTGKDGLSESKQYTGPFSISQTTRIAFEARQNGLISNVAMSELIKLENDKDITLAHQPANQYSSGGANNLIDGIRCSPDFKVGGWLGFEKENLEAVIDLRSEQTVSYFGAGFLQDENSWIFMPIKVNVYVSADGKNFKPAGEVKNTIPYTKSGTFVHTFEIKTTPLKARYIKIIATNRATCPPGHKGNGGSAWMFSDELIVK
jgi:hypothetical protein